MPHNLCVKILKSMIQPATGFTLLSAIAFALPALSQLPTPPVGTPSPMGPPGIQSEQAYTLGAGDRIRIEILRVPQYSGEQEVLIDGSLNLPLVGSVPVQGLTLGQTATALSSQYSRFLRQPIVTVSLIAPRPLRIAIAGEVNRPGSYALSAQGAQFPTVTQALTLAGGITQSADLRNAQVRRRQGLTQQITIPVDLWQLLQTGNLSQDITLRDGDTIFIPTTTSINPSEAARLASASFAAPQNQPLNVAIVGEVYRPGTHTVAGRGGSGGLPTVTQAIEVAGGIKPQADIRRVQIRRPTRGGSEQTIEVNLWQLLETGDLQQDVILQEGDTIFIPTATTIDLAETSQLTSASFFSDQGQPLNIAVVGEVYRPGPYTVTGTARTGAAGVPGGTGGGGTLPTVTRAIQVAGGITPEADIRQVQIRRPTRTGIEQIIQVDLWQLLQAGDSTQDTILQEGDTVFIPTATEISTIEAGEIAAASFSPDTIKVNIVGEVRSPGIVQVPPNTPLNQGLLAAGGFTNRSRRGSVQLIRLNPNGTVSRRRIEIDFSNPINEQSNPSLGNNDVVIVGRSTLATVSDVLDTVLRPVGSFFSLFNFLRIFTP